MFIKGQKWTESSFLSCLSFPTYYSYYFSVPPSPPPPPPPFPKLGTQLACEQWNNDWYVTKPLGWMDIEDGYPTVIEVAKKILDSQST